MKKGIVALLVVAAIPFFVFAYTSPGKPTGYVNDFAQVLEPAERTELNSFLTDFKQKTGAAIAVVTVPTLGDEVVENYAVKLFEEWGIGEKGKDNGVLLLVAMQEKKIRIEVGYGLEGDLTDAQASSIIRNIMQPAFKKGDYSGGILQAVHAMTQIIEKNPEYVLPQESKPQFNGDWVFYLIFIPIYLSSILARSKSWWAGGVIGGIIGIVLGFIYGFIFTGLIAVIGLAILGLIFDFFISKAYHSNVSRGMNPPWWTGGRGGGGFGGGGFGGFGGGRSGGGGASGGW